ncbi:phospholipase D zeta 1 [Physcomitrium patens]|uniref:Phospholipase n=1 Tax=Physcomitrium patens TaxID=3218 RepID=A0A2K1JKL5_PHYPA|nr:phospholipase D zeta 1-like [Physcomitrium patens]XP_024392692.1 phospholipase D zeta 1-like [Physcomitrium patens]XP_024392693.1 phospholipase D zeta 1-like [Physcomitrium patens]XP_024392694.1 phospholipase D zeta 1-like [Physcomitrium patens]PNR42098.1 hypothetical protein PHYPA_016927 [Physcomitrium patens]|eukprot:XP_024392691.1 phospholipase D zeta 1-like [Physcomitrella patens]
MLDNAEALDEDLGTKFQYAPLPMDPMESDVLQGSFEQQDPIFTELPTARVVEVSRSERNDQSLAFQLVYTIELQYKQFTWRLERKATQLLFLHLALKKRALLEDIQERQEQIKEWAHNLGFGDEHPSTSTTTNLRSHSSHHERHSSQGGHSSQHGRNNSQDHSPRHWRHNSQDHSSHHGRHNSQDHSAHHGRRNSFNLSGERRLSLDRQQHSSLNEGQNDENQEGAQDFTLNPKRDIPSSAALPVIRPAIGRLPDISPRATAAMQNYLNHFLESLDIVNTVEVCKFLEVSSLSFTPEYGPKLQEGYMTVKHLPRFPDERSSSCSRFWESCWCCFNTNWQEVWAVLKPGFLVLLADPFVGKPLDIILFDMLSSSENQVALAEPGKERNPLKFSFVVNCGNRELKFRTSRAVSARDWVDAINNAAVKPSDGWCNPHRFGSYAPQRGMTADGSVAQWFIDGRAAFDAIMMAIESAQSEIFLTGWWLCPELYLRRPFMSHESSRLDVLLESKAKEGVQIYVLLYKEVSMALKINSNYSKRRLQGIHENIKVLRWPDHFSSGVYLWSHHEKLVIVDHHVCFLGGLDLCYGRYDDPNHRVWDSPPSIWPGKDYYNPRESEPNSWEDAMKDELDRNKLPRMPWHDVQCAIWGPACRDVARHFVQRWNFAKRNKAPNTKAIPILLPHQHMVIPHYLTGQEEEEAKVEVEVARQQAADANKLASYASIPLLIPKELDTSRLDTRGSGTLFDGYGSGIAKEFSGLQPMRSSGRVVPCPDSTTEPGFISSDYVITDSKESSFKEKADDNFSFTKATPPEHGLKENHTDWWGLVQPVSDENLDMEGLGDIGPRSHCKIQVIRSVGQWSAGTTQLEERSIHAAYCSLIEKAEHFIYIENQFFISGMDDDDTIRNRVLQALYVRIMRAHSEGKCFRVIVVMPLLPGFQGGVDDAGAASVRFIMHWQFRTICRGRHSLLHRLQASLGPQANDYVSFYGLRNHGRLENGPLATSQIYVHSKLMIVDDRLAIIGSANLNDRSLLGSRDSEMGVVLEDQEFVNSKMNGKPWRAGRFVHSLRLSLWSEHLGVDFSNIETIVDPVGDATYKEVWMKTAQRNTDIYQATFACIPADNIHSRSALRQAAAQRKEKMDQNTIDLGIAPEPLDQDGRPISQFQNKQLEAVQGHLVNFPLNFMSDEDLRPVFKESEYYASAQIFH